MGAQHEIDQNLLADSQRLDAQAPRFDGICVGYLVGILEGAVPLVTHPHSPVSAALPARTVIDLRGQHIGEEVVLQFENGDVTRPIVMGVLRKPNAWPLEKQPEQVTVEADGERLAIDAKNEIVLRCGKASITLTKAGKVLIKGTYISSRSSGANRIKGGSVLLN